MPVNTKKIYDRIKKRRTELRMSQGDLAERAEYRSRAGIGRMESGAVDIPISKLFSLSQALGLHPAALVSEAMDGEERLLSRQLSTAENQLLDYFASMDDAEQKELLEIARLHSHPKADIMTETYCDLPFYPMDKSEASLGIVASSRDPLAVEPTTEAIESNYVLKTSGSSMAPTYPVGCYIIIKTEAFQPPHPGDPVIAKVNGKIYFKLYEGPSELRSVNSDIPPVKGDVECLGIVTGIAHRVPRKGRVSMDAMNVRFYDKSIDPSMYADEVLPLDDSTVLPSQASSELKPSDER